MYSTVQAVWQMGQDILYANTLYVMNTHTLYSYQEVHDKNWMMHVGVTCTRMAGFAGMPVNEILLTIDIFILQPPICTYSIKSKSTK